MPFRNLLSLELRFPENSRSLEFASELAGLLGACLTVGADPFRGAPPFDRTAPGARERLAKVRHELRKMIHQIRTPHRSRRTHLEILEPSASSSASIPSGEWDLVIMTHAGPGSGIWTRWGPWERRLLKHIHTPILLRPPGASAHFERVGVVLGSGIQPAEAEFLLSLARSLHAGPGDDPRLDAGIDALCTLPMPGLSVVASPLRGVGAQGAACVVGRVSDRRRAEVTSMLQGLGAEPPRIHILAGPPEERVRTAARQLELDLLIAAPCDDLKAPQRMARRIHCPLLVIPVQDARRAEWGSPAAIGAHP